MDAAPGTPLPWRVRHYASGALDCIQGSPVHPQRYGDEVVNRMARPASDRAKQDAAYIVTACNAFPELLEALEFLANAARFMPGISPMALQQADASIAKARGQS